MKAVIGKFKIDSNVRLASNILRLKDDIKNERNIDFMEAAAC